VNNEIKPSNNERSDHDASVFGKIIGIVLLVISVISDPLLAETDPLTELGIDPKILDVMVSDLSQDLAYTQQVDITIETESQSFHDRALVFYKPATEYGIDLFMKFDEKMETMAPRKFRNMLENRMRLQHRLKVMEFQYDPKTIQVESQDGDKAVISFRYRKTALPQAVAWMRFLQGRVWVEGNKVIRIRLQSDEGRSFMTDGAKVSNLELEADFIRVANGKDLLKQVNSSFTAKYYGLKLFKWGEQFTVLFSTQALSYKDENNNVLFAADEQIPDILEDSEDLETVRVKLDRTFPIWGKEIRSMGFDLPRPFGVSFMYNTLTTRMDFTSFEINGQQEAIEAIFEPNGSGIDVDAKVPQFRGDWFILPFLNVMVIAGNATAEGDLLIRTTDLAQLVGLPEIIEETISLDLTALGVGLTAAVGYNNFIASATVTYVETVTSGADTKSEALSFTPLLGYQLLDYRMNLLIGAEYLDLQENMTGSIPLENGEVLDFNIGTETEAWAWRVGIHKEWGNHWESVVSYSWGEDRDGWNLMFGYRW
jgi:hypothetical protein